MKNIKDILSEDGNFKRNKNLTEEQKKQREEAEKKKEAYFKSLKEEKKQIKVSPSQIFKKAIEVFKEITGKDFIYNQNSIHLLYTLTFYFADDLRFYNSPLLSDKSKSDLKKGLLIIGDFGVGKSVMFEVFYKLFSNTDKRFRFTSTNKVISDYEACDSTFLKKEFWRKNSDYVVYYDDIKTERMASNYGKVNVMKDILEERYKNKAKTYISCNYKEGYPDNITEALVEFREIYGDRVYDRIFEMFNIIEVKGTSFRD